MKQLEKWKQSRLYDICVRILFPVLLALYPLKHIIYGVEWWDTGYNYANFTYMKNMDSMWFFSTYLANIVGHLLTKLPFGDRMLGLNFYTGLLVSVLVLVCYFFFVKKVQLPPVIVFVGEVIAIGLCWCPTAVLYNYLTYLFMLLGVLCLYRALTREQTGFFVLSGIFLGINVFVRFSNLAQAAFILAVWAFAIICKKKLRTVIQWTAWCLLGYVIGLGGILGLICIRYGGNTYVEAVQRLFAMTEEAAGYSMSSMVIYQLQNYLQNLIWLFYMLPFVLLGVAVFAVWPHKFTKIKRVCFICGMFLVFYWLRNQNMFNMKYSTKPSVFQWAVFLLTFTMIGGVCTICSRTASREDKLLCGLSMLIAVLTPLGSNNHLYSSINNLFFGAPVILWILWKGLRAVPEEKVVKAGKVKVSISSWPLKAAVCMILFMLLVQSIGFGIGYVFSETDGGENLHTKIENSDILKGMYTDETRARQLQTLLDYVQENGLTGREVILYGNIPSLSYYLKMPFAISPWPDLASYNYGVMQEDLEKVRQEILKGEEAPVILLEIKYGACLTEGSEIPEDRKFALLMDFAEELGYETSFANDKFVLLEK